MLSHAMTEKSFLCSRCTPGRSEQMLKTPWREGTIHIVMSPLEFMQRLAALVPRPRLHLIRFHGVLVPNANLCALVVSQAPEPPTQAPPAAEREAICSHHHPVRLSWARNRRCQTQMTPT